MSRLVVSRLAVLHVAALSMLAMPLCMPAPATAATVEICQPYGYVVGFFNGIWNTRVQADEALRHLREMNGEFFKGQRLGFELLYNQTGADRQGGSALEDLAELFQQRSHELDGALTDRWEIFWEVLAGSADETPGASYSVTAIAQAGIELKQLLDAFRADVNGASAASWSRLLADPPTANDYAAQYTRIMAWLAEHKKLILVAHSQGNLFLNRAYDAAVAATRTQDVRVLHIAPASPTWRGPHVLADLDLVINLLRTQGAWTIAPSTATLPFSHLLTDDASGHTLAATYLNMSRQTGQQVHDVLQTELAELVPPGREDLAGFFTATLTWNGSGDMDLHVVEPDGSHVFHRTHQGATGYLDADNREAYGPEHYYATCDVQRLQTGIYSIGINHYEAAEGRTATLQIASAADGEIYTRAVEAGPAMGSAGNDAPRMIARVEVARNASGAYGVRMLAD